MSSCSSISCCGTCLRTRGARCRRAAFAVLSTAMLYALGAAVRTGNGTVGFGERMELARLWSANVEYSEENMRAALDELT